MTVDGEQFRREAHRIEKWSVGWMLLALVMWGWFGFRWSADNNRGLGRYAEASNESVGILALAVIPTIIGAATIVYAQVLFRLARQVPSEAE